MLKCEVAFLSGAAPVTPSPTFAGLNGSDWAKAMLFGDMVKFVQEAVEWENLLYFLYPYFWGGEAQGRDKMLFEHPDPEHQNFLWAGTAGSSSPSARVSRKTLRGLLTAD